MTCLRSRRAHRPICASATRREHRNNERGDRKCLSPDALSQPAVPRDDSQTQTPRAAPRRRTPRGYLWAELMRRTFEIDVLTCPRCGGRLRLVALIEQASVVQRILRHLGPLTEVPEPRPARAPPGDSRRSRISLGRRSNSTRRGEGVASREGGVRAAPRSCPPTVIFLWYSRLFDDNRTQTPTLSALCGGRG